MNFYKLDDYSAYGAGLAGLSGGDKMQDYILFQSSILFLFSNLSLSLLFVGLLLFVLSLILKRNDKSRKDSNEEPMSIITPGMILGLCQAVIMLTFIGTSFKVG